MNIKPYVYVLMYSINVEENNTWCGGVFTNKTKAIQHAEGTGRVPVEKCNSYGQHYYFIEKHAIDVAC